MERSIDTWSMKALSYVHINMEGRDSEPMTTSQKSRSKASRTVSSYYRAVYHVFGFQKGYNFPFYLITVGALFGFVLARFEYLSFNGIYMKVSLRFDHFEFWNAILTTSPRKLFQANSIGIVLAIEVLASSFTSPVFFLVACLPLSNSHLSSVTSFGGFTVFVDILPSHY